MGSVVLLASCILTVFLLIRDPLRVSSRRGWVYWWSFSAFGYQICYLVATSVGIVTNPSGFTSYVARFGPMFVVGLVLAIKALADRDFCVPVSSLLLVLPILYSLAFCLDGGSLAAPSLSLVGLLPALVVPKHRWRLNDFLLGVRESLMAALALFSILALLWPKFFGPCRSDKCSLWDVQIGSAGSANALGVALAATAVVACIGLRPRATVAVCFLALAIIDLTCSRSALFVIGAGIASAVVPISAGRIGDVYRRLILVATGLLVLIIPFLNWGPEELTERPILWDRAKLLIADNPVFGYGTSFWVRQGRTNELAANYSTHNLGLETLVSFGALGLLLTVAAICAAVWASQNQSPSLIILALWLGAGVTEVAAAPGRPYLFPGLLVAAFLVGELSSSAVPKSGAKSSREWSSEDVQLQQLN